ncbi:sigma-54-dependent transcriptional regulator [Celeribacter sp.]|uniref:sigma-54-dependent transcriptional regulator n=1 Tax=Celeribacter sp. TaxID=1890673 RepID=UPI003A92174F
MTENAPRIYVVDDDADFREATCEFLTEEGLTARGFADGQSMLDMIDPEWDGIVLTDIRMAGLDGFSVLKAAKQAAPEVPVVMITGHGDVRLAIAAIKAGAYDFLEKPVQPDVLISMMQRTLNARKLVIENKRLRRRMARRGGMASQLIGRSGVMKTCRQALLDLAPLPITVTLFGEAGTGKSLAAQILHEYGEGEGAFSVLNCGTIGARGLQGDLDALGRDTVTLYVRAVHKLDHKDQTLLADYLRSRDRPRVVLSHTGSLAQPPNISDELLYLINVASLEMPPLRDREKDVYLLLETFLRGAAQQYAKRLPNITKDMLAPLGKHRWPGNVRELRNVAERMVIGLAPNLDDQQPKVSHEQPRYEDAMLAFERTLLEHALRETGGRKSEAAALLAIPRKRLYLRLRAVGLSTAGRN